MAISNKSLTDAELATYRDYFWKQDTSGDGRLSITEFKNMMDSMGMNLNPKEVRKAFNAADTDRSGDLTFKEFTKMFLNRDAETAASFANSRLQEVFRTVDVDHDGLLTREECINALKMLHKKMSDKGVTRIMQIMDRNCDGGISLEEFSRFFGNE